FGIETKLHDDLEEARTRNGEFRRRRKQLSITRRNIHGEYSDG
ncbi:hypothetical protein LINGRAHAP2_LOCUS8014, partial [Linum grandiflorum]